MLPYLLAIAGGYLIGNSMNETPKFDEGGELKNAKNYWEKVYYGGTGRKETLVKAGYSQIEAKKLSKKSWKSLDKKVQEDFTDTLEKDSIYRYYKKV